MRARPPVLALALSCALILPVLGPLARRPAARAGEAPVLLRPGEERRGRLRPGEARSYAPRATGAGPWRAVLSGDPGMRLELVDAETGRLRGEAARTFDGPARVRLLVERPSARLLRVRATTDAPARYVLGLSPYRPAPDDHADGPARASLLPYEEALDGTLERPGDEDWFRFPAAAGDEVEVEVRSLEGGGPLRVERFDAVGERLRDAVRVEPGRARRLFLCPLRGTPQRLRIRGESRDAGHRYRVRWGPLRDDHGDGASSATPIAPGARAEGDLETYRDRDVFALRLRGRRPYRAVFAGVFRIELRGPGGRPRVLGRYGATRVFVPARDGLWTIHVPPDLPGHYTLRVLPLDPAPKSPGAAR